VYCPCVEVAFEEGRLSYTSTHLQLRTTVNLQKTHSSNSWNRNNYQTVSCSNYWNLICQIRNDHHRNRKLLQNLSPLCLNQTAIEKTYATKRIVLLKKLSYTLSKNNSHCYDERSNFKGVKNFAVNFEFRWQRAPRLKVLWIPHRRYTSSFDWKCKFARLIVGAARGTLWRWARLEAISPIGQGPALYLGIWHHLGFMCTICWSAACALRKFESWCWWNSCLLSRSCKCKSVLQNIFD